MALVKEAPYRRYGPHALAESSGASAVSGPRTTIIDSLITSQYWSRELRRNRDLSHLPATMLVSPSDFDMDDDGPVDVVTVVESYDDEYDW